VGPKFIRLCTPLFLSSRPAHLLDDVSPRTLSCPGAAAISLFSGIRTSAPVWRGHPRFTTIPGFFCPPIRRLIHPLLLLVGARADRNSAFEPRRTYPLSKGQRKPSQAASSCATCDPVRPVAPAPWSPPPYRWRTPFRGSERPLSFRQEVPLPPGLASGQHRRRGPICFGDPPPLTPRRGC